MRLKQITAYLTSPEFIFLILFLIKFWLFVWHLSEKNKFSKQKFYAQNDELFLFKFNQYQNSSLNSLKQIKQWLIQNPDKISNGVLFNNLSLIRERKNEEDTLCVGILSKQRNNANDKNYPLQTVVSLLTRIPLKYQDRVLISLFNVDQTFRSDLNDLKGLIEIINLQQNISSKIESFDNKKIKECADYASVMRYFYDYRPECALSLLLEDDSIAALDWYNKIIASTNSLRDTHWFCLKLFTSFRALDWIIHAKTVLKTLFLILILSIFLIYLFYFLILVKKYICTNYFKHKINFKDNLNKFTIYILVFNVILVNIWFNSVSISPLGYGLRKFSIGFNTVANVYPRSKIKLVSDHLEKNILDYIQGKSSKFYPKDLALNSFRSSSGFEEFILEPSVFQHTGLHSSLGTGLVDMSGIRKVQYRPFQSYSFMKEYSDKIEFNLSFWLS